MADIIAKLYLKFQVPGIFLSFYINKDTKIATSQNLENVSHLVILSLGLHWLLFDYMEQKSVFKLIQGLKEMTSTASNHRR